MNWIKYKGNMNFSVDISNTNKSNTSVGRKGK